MPTKKQQKVQEQKGKDKSKDKSKYNDLAVESKAAHEDNAPASLATHPPMSLEQRRAASAVKRAARLASRSPAAQRSPRRSHAAVPSLLSIDRSTSRELYSNMHKSPTPRRFAGSAAAVSPSVAGLAFDFAHDSYEAQHYANVVRERQMMQNALGRRLGADQVMEAVKDTPGFADLQHHRAIFPLFRRKIITDNNGHVKLQATRLLPINNMMQLGGVLSRRESVKGWQVRAGAEKDDGEDDAPIKMPAAMVDISMRSARSARTRR